MVMQKRVRHIRGTEEEAVRLAQRWGADPDHARRAGILHDCTKYLEGGKITPLQDGGVYCPACFRGT